MDMNDPLRREEKRESAPDRQDSGPKALMYPVREGTIS